MSSSSLPNSEPMEPCAPIRDTKEVFLPAALAPRDRATLVVVTGPNSGRVFTIVGEVLIGRALQCGLQIDDPGVSRIHARIAVEGGSYVLHDMQARNGVFLNGERISTHVLQPGDRLQLGPSVRLRFAMSDEQEETLMRTLHQSSVLDPLTGVFNRGHFDERLASESAYAIRHETELTVSMLDIDHFKKVNDSHGHPAGDRVLEEVGGLIAQAVRGEDVACRFGGEEFAVIAPGVGLREGFAMADSIRLGVARSVVAWGGKSIRITLSAGVASLSELVGDRSGKAMVELADRRLYEAKQSGRNRVVGG